MYNRCCIENCASKRKDIKMHRFPTSEKGLKKWLKCIGSVQFRNISHNVLRKKMFVCHKHFERKFITESDRLCVGSYPTLFSKSEIASGFPSLSSANIENEVEVAMVNTRTDHSYAKRMHEDHKYCKSAVDAPSGTASLHVLMDIGNLPQTKTSDSAENQPGPSHALTHIQDPPLELVKENQPGPSHTLTQIEDSPSPALLEVVKETNVELEGSVTNVSTPRRKKGTRKRLIQKLKNLSPTCKLMYKEYVRSKRQASFSKRAKRAMKFVKSDSFSKLTTNMNPLAKTIFWMQIKQCMKKIKGRRFSMDEKIIALSIMKQSPKCYRFLQRIFILPSRNTLNKMISNLKIHPGINKQIFETIKQDVSTWTETKKYCSVIFDEVSLETGLTFDKGRDSINGFVELEAKTDRFADHALAFMIRGAVHKWQQPIAYYFCEGATKTEQLKVILKTIVAAVVDTGLLPVALICDQGTSFRSALNSLAEDTRREQIKAGENTDGVISLSGHKLSVIYDPPHLIKGIRNNFLTKNILCDGKVSTWNDIVDVYKTDCNHAEARLLHKLTDKHVMPNNIDKMKVKNCTRVLSKTVAAALSYTSQFSQYSDGREVSPTIKNTAETVSFFDDLFDSCNGAALKTRGKNLRKAVTKNSQHHIFWQEAIKKVEKMKFVHQQAGQAPDVRSVPSLKNWVVTLKSFQRLWQFFESKGIKIMRTRYFNSDPIENFFGQVRAYNFRNNDPDCHTFTQTFRSLLITRFIKFHSSGFNCEEDSGRQIIKIQNLFKATELPETERDVATTQNLHPEIMSQETIELQARRERLHVHSRAYTAGWLVGKILSKISCEDCRQDLTTEEGSIHRWISHREYETAKKKKLNYPSEHAVRYFSNFVKITNGYLEKNPHQYNISEKIRKLVLERYPLKFLKCTAHKKVVVECFAALTIRFTIFNWCNTINKILKGTDVLRLDTSKNLPRMQQEALNKYKKKLRNKK